MTEGALEVEVLGPDGSVLRSPGAGGRRRGTRLAAVALAVVALGAVVAFAVSRLTAPSGPQSPEAAVDALFDALAAGDLRGTAEALRPAERDSFAVPALDIFDELARLGVLADDVDVTALGGLSVSFDGVEYTVDPVGTDLAVVTPTGTVNTSLAVADLPLGDAVRDRLDGLPLPEAQLDRSAELEGTRLAVVREDGAWHVSVWYSVAENARRDRGADLPTGPAVEAVGADGPEALVTDLVAALEQLDPAGVLALVDPVEAAPLYEYSGLFVPDLAAAADDVRATAALQIDVSDLDLEVERDGAVARVTVVDPGALSVEASWIDPADGPASLTVEGGCVELTDGQTVGSFEICPGKGAAAPPGIPGLLSPLGGLTDPPNAIVAVERDGRWYLSPGRTLVDSVIASLAELDPSDVDGLLAGLELLAGVPLGTGFGLDLGAGLDALSSGSGDRPAPVDPSTEGDGPTDERLLVSVPLDDPAVAAITAGLPMDLAGVDAVAHYDNAYRTRASTEPSLTVTRVVQLTAGFADITVAESAAMPPLGEPVVVDGHTATVDRFGDGVIVAGAAGGYGIQVSVFGLDPGLEPEAAALQLFARTAEHLSGQ